MSNTPWLTSVLAYIRPLNGVRCSYASKTGLVQARPAPLSGPHCSRAAPKAMQDCQGLQRPCIPSACSDQHNSAVRLTTPALPQCLAAHPQDPNSKAQNGLTDPEPTLHLTPGCRSQSEPVGSHLRQQVHPHHRQRERAPAPRLGQLLHRPARSCPAHACGPGLLLPPPHPRLPLPHPLRGHSRLLLWGHGARATVKSLCIRSMFGCTSSCTGPKPSISPGSCFEHFVFLQGTVGCCDQNLGCKQRAIVSIILQGPTAVQCMSRTTNGSCIPQVHGWDRMHGWSASFNC